MYNLQQRANAVFAFFITVLFSVLAAVALSGYTQLALLPEDATSSSLAVRSVHLKQGRLGYYYDRNKPTTELGYVHFGMNADLTRLFNWNTKQLFIYVVAEYTTPKHDKNQIVIWDDIIQTKEDAQIQFRKKEPEYVASDLSGKLK
ncbi:hypothetical protein HK097_009786 [Rhizophlyctis rosea]|uniref:Signal peptidase subunit 3 n=1 Tax=Rhizophlyctis rosea TaxID=64517 RepID=A0AAD5X570_9FUNG|nr:hypothetical protein HK097_009786 [Rhizophlyctis rosea]